MDAADQHPQDLKNQDPMFVINLGTDLLASYGWYMLLAVIGFLVLWRKTLQETVNKWRDRAQQGTMNSEVEQHRRDEEMRAARLRMQERFNATAEVELARMQELEKQRDEERRKQKVEEWERLQQGKGYYSKNRTQTETNDVPATLGTRKPKDNSEVEQHRRDEEMRAARLRMQERFNATAEVELARMQELEKQRDEERRKQKVEEWERLQQGKGYYSKNRTQTETNDVPATLGTRKPKDSGRGLRNNDYNPLTGGSSSSNSGGYRPSRRGGPAGGG